MNMDKIEIKPYDTYTSILLKYGQLYKLPTSSLIPITKDPLVNILNPKTVNKIEIKPLVGTVEKWLKNNVINEDTLFSLADSFKEQSKIILSYIFVDYLIKNDITNQDSIILGYINKFYEYNNFSSVNFINELKAKISQWKQNQETSRNKEKDKLKVFEKVFNILDNTEQLPVSTFIIDKVDISSNIKWTKKLKQENVMKELKKMTQDRPTYNPIIPGEKVQTIDALDIYNISIPSVNVPFISLQSPNNFYIKLYKPKNSSEDIDPRKYIPKSVFIRKDKNIGFEELFGNIEDLEDEEDFFDDEEDNNDTSVRFTLWDNREDGLDIASQESFHNGIIDFKSGRIIILDIDFSVVTIDQLKKWLKEAFPFTSIENIVNRRISGQLTMKDVPLYEHVFLHMVLNDFLTKSYVFADENTNPVSLKKRLELLFRPNVTGLDTTKEMLVKPETLKFSIFSQKVVKDEIMTIPKDEVFAVTLPGLGPSEIPSSFLKLINKDEQNDFEKIVLKEGTNLLNINIISALSLDTIELFVNVFPRIIKNYIDNQSSILNVFSLIPNHKILENIFYEENKYASSSKNSKILKEKSRLEELKEKAPNVFVTGYARRCQSPHVILISLSEVEKWEKKTGRQALPFPKDNPQWYFGCDSDDLPYPGVFINKLSNKNIYPVLPCCFKESQFSASSRVETTKNYYEGKLEEKQKFSKGGNSYLLNGDKILNPGKVGKIPEVILRLLKTLNNKGSYHRFGVPLDNLSFIHCILQGGNIDDDYTNSKFIKDRYKIAKKYRDDIIKKMELGEINIFLLAQEFWNDTNIILDTFKNEKRNINSELFIYLLEIYFDVNIYVFTKNEKEKVILEIPKHDKFYVKNMKNKQKTIIIYKHFGNNADNLTEKHYELISYNPSSKDNNVMVDTTFEVSIYDDNYNKLLYNLFLDQHKVFFWKEENNKIKTYVNKYSKISFYEMLIDNNFNIEGQYIDNKGKNRGFLVKREDINGNKPFSFFTFPGQPINIKKINDSFIANDYKEIINIFGLPSHQTINDNKLKGFWYSYNNINFAMFIPIILPENNTILENIKITSKNISFEPMENISVKRLKILENKSRIILKLILWVFLFTKLTPIKFTIKFFKLQKSDEDSLNIYDLNNLPRMLPKVSSFDLAMKFLEEKVPSLVNKEQFIIYSDKMYRGILYFLEDYANSNNTNVLTDSQLSLNIKEKTTNINDLEFSNLRELNLWLEARNKNINIKEKIDLDIAFKNDPIIYHSINYKCYLIIQNVLEGDYQRAVTTSYYWIKNKINIGFKPTDKIMDEIKENLINQEILVMGITIEGDIAPVKKIKDIKENVIDIPVIIKYTEDYYGSILLLNN